MKVACSFQLIKVLYSCRSGGAVASWLVRLTPDRSVRSGLCVLGQDTTLTVPLSTQVYKWVPARLILGGNPAMDLHPIQVGIEMVLVASCYRNRDKTRPGVSLS